jgi:RNA polymerase sigma-70 factor (ECF subfamily)
VLDHAEPRLADVTSIRHHPAHAVDARAARVVRRWGPHVGRGGHVSRAVDVALVERARRGDHEAFEAIVGDSIDRLFALATLMIRDRTLAEDAVQDAYARAWRDLPGLKDPQRLDAWLSRLTVNATYDLLRRRKHVRRALPLEAMPHTTSEQPGPVDRLDLAEAYGRLPPEQRAIVILHYYLGLPLDEIARTLAIPPGTVRSRLHAALRSMRSWLGTADVRPTAAVGEPR